MRRRREGVARGPDEPSAGSHLLQVGLNGLARGVLVEPGLAHVTGVEAEEHLAEVLPLVHVLGRLHVLVAW